MNKAIIACRKASYHPFEGLAYEHLAGLGIRFVEIDAPPPDQVDQTAAELQNWGLSASSLQTRCDVRQADYVRQIEATMPVFTADILSMTSSPSTTLPKTA